MKVHTTSKIQKLASPGELGPSEAFEVNQCVEDREAEGVVHAGGALELDLS